MTKKPKRTQWLRLGLTAWLCVLAVCLCLGVTLGRYRKELETKPVSFWSAQTAQINLWGAATEEGVLQPLTGWTETGSGTVRLDFQVSNGTQTMFCDVPLWFGVRVDASLGIGDPANVAMTLTVDGRQYQAKATPIPEGSSRYNTFGPGWTYAFYDAVGEEASFELTKGQFSTVEVALSVTGGGEYLSLMQMEVSAHQ